MGLRVLLVDDDAAVLGALRRALTLDGYDVLLAADGEAALTIALEGDPDCVILDLMLPGLDGLTVCRRLREKRPALPVLMLSARDTVPDRVAGLDAGADDYLVKPFAVDELLARLRALRRRAQAREAETEGISYLHLRIDPGAREAFCAGQPLRLTPLEYELLEAFMRHPRLALSREQLCQQVWGFGYDAESNFVDVAVKELRKKLEADGRPRLIQTVRGVGYSLREE